MVMKMIYNANVTEQKFVDKNIQSQSIEDVLDFVWKKGKSKQVTESVGSIVLENDCLTMQIKYRLVQRTFQVKVGDSWKAYHLSTDGLCKAIADIIFLLPADEKEMYLSMYEKVLGM